MPGKPFSHRLGLWVRWSYGGLPFYVSVGGLVIACGLGLWHYRGQLWRSPIVCWLTLVAVGMVFQSRFAYVPEASWIGLHHFLPYFLLFAVLIQGLKAVDDWCGVVKPLLMISVPVNLAGVVEYGLKFEAVEAVLGNSLWLSWMYQGEYLHRSASTFGNANVYGAYLVILWGLGLGLLMQHWQTDPRSTASQAVNEPWFGGAIALIAIGIFCSGSRNALLVALTQVGLMMAMSWRAWRVQVMGILGIGTLLLSARLGGIGKYAFTVESLTKSVIEDSRINTWSIAWRLIQSRPWQGWGLGSYQHLYPIMNSKIEYLTMSHAHNTLLMFWVEMGAILTIALMLPIGYIAYRGVRAYISCKASLLSRPILGSYLLALWGILLFSLFDVPFYDPRINALNWLVVAGVYQLSRL